MKVALIRSAAAGGTLSPATQLSMEALPRELILSIDQVLGSQDADPDLDAPTFNLENALNEVFPDGKADCSLARALLLLTPIGIQ